MHVLKMFFFICAALLIQNTIAMQARILKRRFIIVNVLPFPIKVSIKNKNGELVLNQQVVDKRSSHSEILEHENWPLFLETFRENGELLLDISFGSDVSGAEFYLSTDKDNPIGIAVLQQNRWKQLE